MRKPRVEERYSDRSPGDDTRSMDSEDHVGSGRNHKGRVAVGAWDEGPKELVTKMVMVLKPEEAG